MWKECPKYNFLSSYHIYIYVVCTYRGVCVYLYMYIYINYNFLKCYIMYTLIYLIYIGASLVAQRVKSLPAMWETQVRSLGQEDPLEKEMATHSSILARRIPVDRGAWWATAP